MEIDQTTYNVAEHHKLGQGHAIRRDAYGREIEASSIVIHSTNNVRKGTSFDSEGDWLRDALTVSAHYLVGRDGRIAKTCSEKFQAFHAGVVSDPRFGNDYSIGIELHISVGERPTAPQLASLTELVLDIMRRRSIPRHLIETHRKVAYPAGRKPDPEGWTDAAFYLWRSKLSAGVLVGEYIIDPRIHPWWLQSGGVWKPNLATPGYPVGPAFEWGGKVRQLFQRVGATVEPNGVSWMLVDEYLEARSALEGGAT